MKRTIVLLFLLSVTSGAGAQNFSEWFRQKATQKKYLLQQIAALKVYTEYLKKGYEIAHDGLDLIGDFKRGEFDLHKSYFSSLKTVNRKIKGNSKVEGIIDRQERIVALRRRSLRQATESNAFSEEEMGYIRRVYDRLLDECNATLNDLQRVLTDGTLEMKDDERIKRIDRLDQDMTGHYTFCKHFSDELKLMQANRYKERKDVETLQKLNSFN